MRERFLSGFLDLFLRGVRLPVRNVGLDRIIKQKSFPDYFEDSKSFQDFVEKYFIKSEDESKL